MSRLSQLIPVIALRLGMKEMAVEIISRHAMAAGHISKRGRGRYGADMTPTDAANLLIASLKVKFGWQSKDAGEIIEAYRTIRRDPKSCVGRFVTHFGGGAEPETFGEGIDRVIADPWESQRLLTVNLEETAASLKIFSSFGEILMDSQYSTSIRAPGEGLDFNINPFREPPPDQDAHASYYVTSITIAEISRVLRS